MVLFTHNVKKIKDATYKNGNIYGTCKRGLIYVNVTCSGNLESEKLLHQEVPPVEMR